MKKAKKMLAIILSTAMLAGTVLSANAAARLSVPSPCTLCNKVNVAIGQEGFCSCREPYYTYVCTACKTLYRVCSNGHYYGK